MSHLSVTEVLGGGSNAKTSTESSIEELFQSRVDLAI